MFYILVDYCVFVLFVRMLKRLFNQHTWVQHILFTVSHFLFRCGRPGSISGLHNIEKNRKQHIKTLLVF